MKTSENISVGDSKLVSLFPHKSGEINETLTIKKRSDSFLLRRSEYLANIPHWCDCCFSYIVPGEMYEKDIRVMDGRIVEFKRHTNPSCEPPQDPDFDDDKDQSTDIDYSMAA